MTLDEIAVKSGTDKSSTHHNYTKWYERYFEPIRNQKLNILELGFGGHEDPEAGGNSAEMWRNYFPNATIVIIDNEAKSKKIKGVNFHQGSQDDHAFLQSLFKKYGEFDIIIDDASHISSLTIKSWEILYPFLKSNGVYVVEDTHMAYHDFYYGKDEANENPDLPCNGNFPTAMQYFKRMADEVNAGLFPEKYHIGFDLEYLHFYYNILFIGKK